MLVVLTVFVGLTAACGGSPNGPSPNPSPSPTPAPVRVVFRPFSAEFGPGTQSVAVEFSIQAAGTLEVIVEVTPGPPAAYAQIDLIAGTLAACSASPDCQRLKIANDPSVARQVLQYHVVPGTYAVRIFKIGASPASARGEFALTPDA